MHETGDDIIALIDFSERARISVSARGSHLIIEEVQDHATGAKAPPIEIPVISDGEIMIYNSHLTQHGDKTRLSLEITINRGE